MIKLRHNIKINSKSDPIGRIFITKFSSLKLYHQSNKALDKFVKVLIPFPSQLKNSNAF